jgi:preprotein translocase SecF subunit
VVDLFRYRHWDLVSKRGIYYTLSGLLLAVGLILCFTRGLNQGIDFKGGDQITYNVNGTLPDHTGSIGDIRTALQQEGQKANDPSLQSADVEIATSGQVAGTQNDQILVSMVLPPSGQSAQHNAQLDSEIATTITPAVNAAAAKAGKTAEMVSKDSVSGTISNDLKTNAIVAGVIGSILIMFWIGIRYNVGGLGARYSFAGIIALLHDLGILFGMFAIFRGLQVNSPFVAAVLTVLGYSIHDTIVIFDRIRENLRLRKGRTFAETVNISLLETMARSVNTILTVLFSLLALYFFGGSTLRDFVVAMIIGVIVGGYSSIFIASQLLVTWSKGKDRIILPMGELATATAGVTPRPIGGVVAPPPAGSIQTAAAPSAATPEAIQRARQAGKTSRRNR